MNGGEAYGLGAEMLNFGALIAFMGVNVAALLRYYVRAKEKKLGFLIPPVLGFVICLALWLNLSRPAIIVGSIWMLAGIALESGRPPDSARKCRLKYRRKSKKRPFQLAIPAKSRERISFPPRSN